MVLLKRILSISFCLALVVVLAIPSFAVWPAPLDLTDTAWRFDETIALPPFTGYLSTYISDDVSFTFGDNSIIYDDMYWDGSTLYFQLQSNGSLYTAYSSGTGWRQQDMRTVGFTSAMGTVNNNFSTWLFDNSVLVFDSSVNIPVVTWVIDNELFPFSDETGTTPTIGLTVNASGAVLALYTREFNWFYLGDAEFTGLSTADDNTPEYPVGYNGSLPSSSPSDIILRLYPCFADDRTYSTTINIRSNDGSSQQFTFTDYGVGSSPLLQARVTSYGLDILRNGSVIDSFSFEDDFRPAADFTGFSGRRNALVPTYGIDAVITVGGQADNSSLDLYSTWAVEPSLPGDADWTSWIITAVGGFFAFEFWQGLSLGDLLLTIISISLLFAFLKLTV